MSLSSLSFGEAYYLSKAVSQGKVEEYFDTKGGAQPHSLIQHFIAELGLPATVAMMVTFQRRDDLSLLFWNIKNATSSQSL
jgi:hypothetical protein